MQFIMAQKAFEQLRKDWFINKKHVGITAGTSTPENVINEVHTKILEIAKDKKGQASLASWISFQIDFKAIPLELRHLSQQSISL